MSEYVLSIQSIEETIFLGRVIGQALSPNKVIALRGDLGAGKTTLTKGIGLALGVEETINSPTFTIMKIYKTKREDVPYLYHLDVYRTQGSVSDFDLEEYFYLGGATVVEWADIISDLLPSDTLYLTIKILGESTREVVISGNNYNLIEKVVQAFRGKKHV